jgi:hypothetical protein
MKLASIDVGSRPGRLTAQRNESDADLTRLEVDVKWFELDLIRFEAV